MSRPVLSTGASSTPPLNLTAGGLAVDTADGARRTLTGDNPRTCLPTCIISLGLSRLPRLSAIVANGGTLRRDMNGRGGRGRRQNRQRGGGPRAQPPQDHLPQNPVPPALNSLALSPLARRAVSPPFLLPNSGDGHTSTLSEGREAGFYSTSPTSFGSEHLRALNRAPLNFRPQNYAVAPVSSIAKTTAGPLHSGALFRLATS